MSRRISGFHSKGIEISSGTENLRRGQVRRSQRKAFNSKEKRPGRDGLSVVRSPIHPTVGHEIGPPSCSREHWTFWDIYILGSA
jgi:hypothetical protein